VTSETEVITGTGEAGSAVTVTFPDGTTATATTDHEGQYEVEHLDTVGLTGRETINVTIRISTHLNANVSVIYTSYRTSTFSVTVAVVPSGNVTDTVPSAASDEDKSQAFDVTGSTVGASGAL
ncbi:Ig-like domain-containing protein, partial [Staphylococcus felis]|uniref:Ig-like domain-containing protein n=1 Tax=Staphylococcus felis TaxID=46127 RepID=UPI001EE8E33C